MKIVVQRRPPDSIATLGEMLIDGVHECFTLEPASTFAAGTFDLVIDQSVRFRRLMPHVLNVPGHSGIRIHWGNWAKDTEDCTLVGETVGTDFVGHSVEEFNLFFQKLQAALEQGPVTISYLDPTGGNAGSGTGGK